MSIKTEKTTTGFLDKTDLAILKILQEDSSLTNKEVAARVNLSPTPVFERIKRLEKSGIIKKYAAILDAAKLNKELMIFCNVRLKQHTKELGSQFMEAILAIDEVTECYNISGDYDFILKIYVKNMKHYQDFVLNKLGNIDGIGSLQSLFVMGEIKQTYAIPIIDLQA